MTNWLKTVKKSTLHPAWPIRSFLSQVMLRNSGAVEWVAAKRKPIALFEAGYGYDNASHGPSRDLLK